MRRIFYIFCLVLLGTAAMAENPTGTTPEGPPPGSSLPAYPNTGEISFKGSMNTNDVPMDALVVMTGDPIKQVLEYYRQALQSRGQPIVQHMFSPQSGYVGFYDVDSGTMRMATVVSRPDGGSMIVLSSMDPMPLVEKPTVIPPDLPVVPGAIDIVTSDVEEGSARHRTVSFTLPSTTPSSARNLLLHAAKKQNWKPAPAQKPFNEQDLVFIRKAEMCIVKIHALPAGKAGGSSTSITFIVVDRGTE
jgi:hypothetical protein